MKVPVAVSGINQQLYQSPVCGVVTVVVVSIVHDIKTSKLCKTQDSCYKCNFIFSTVQFLQKCICIWSLNSCDDGIDKPVLLVPFSLK